MARGTPHASRAAQSAQALPPPLAAVNLHAAGIDVGADAHDVAVPPRADAAPVRGVGACTVDLEAWADGLAPGDMTTVARESTGGEGMSLFALREPRGVEVWRVDPPQGQNIKGRPQRAVHDCPWGQRRHTCGRRACDAVTDGRGACGGPMPASPSSPGRKR